MSSPTMPMRLPLATRQQQEQGQGKEQSMQAANKFNQSSNQTTQGATKHAGSKQQVNAAGGRKRKADESSSLSSPSPSPSSPTKLANAPPSPSPSPSISTAQSVEFKPAHTSTQPQQQQSEKRQRVEGNEDTENQHVANTPLHHSNASRLSSSFASTALDESINSYGANTSNLSFSLSHAHSSTLSSPSFAPSSRASAPASTSVSFASFASLHDTTLSEAPPSPNSLSLQCNETLPDLPTSTSMHVANATSAAASPTSAATIPVSTSSISAALDASTSEMNSLSRNYASLVSKVWSLASQSSLDRAYIQSMKDELLAAKTRNAQLESDNDKLQSRVDELERRATSAESNARHMQIVARCLELEQERSSKESKAKSSSSSSIAAASGHTPADSSDAIVSRELQRQIAAHRDALASKESVISQLIKDKAKTEAELSALRQTYTAHLHSSSTDRLHAAQLSHEHRLKFQALMEQQLDAQRKEQQKQEKRVAEIIKRQQEENEQYQKVIHELQKSKTSNK